MTATQPARLAVLLLIGLAAGFMSGLIGIGGGLVIIPLLTLVLSVAQKKAQTSSLGVVLLASATGAISYGVQGQLDVLIAAGMAVGGVLGSFAGTAILRRTGDGTLKLGFVALALVTAAAMFADVRATPPDWFEGVSVAKIVALIVLGAAVGMLAGLLGVGGGVLMVPALTLLVALTPQQAQATSLAVIVVISLVSVARNRSAGYLDLRLTVPLALAALAAAPIGVRVAMGLDAETMRRTFGVFLLLVAAAMARDAYVHLRNRRGETAEHA